MKRVWMATLMGTLLVTGMSAATIHQRRARQQERIAGGVASGRLTPGETAALEAREARLNREIRADRRDGGGLSIAERARIQRRQDRLSREISRDKHNGLGR